jgi:uncharacterized membrane protein YgdD (TMEM256/DUF423 family)
MRSDRWILAAGALLGLGGVIAGALLDHAAATLVLEQHAADTALRYQQLHAVIIAALGLVLTFFPLLPHDRKRLALSAKLLVAGTVIFSGSLYALAFTGNAHAAYGTPLGGITLMAGWTALVWAALRHRSSD